MWLRLLLIIGIIGLAEYYSFIVVKSMTRGLTSTIRISLMGTYLFFTVISWVGFLLFRVVNWAAVPHLLRNIYIAFVLGFLVGKVIILLLMLVDDLRRLFTWIITSMAFSNAATSDTTPKVERSVFIKQVSIVLAGLSLIGFTYGIRNRYNYHVRKIKLAFGNLPDKFKGMKIVQVSDIHTGSFDNHDAVERGIKLVLDQKPDIIFFTGDLVNNHAMEVDDKYKQIFAQLKAPMGVYSILGNHDYGDYVEWETPAAKVANLDKLKATHAEMGWRLMMNEHIEFEREGQKIAVVGIENWSSKAHFPKYGDMAKAYIGLKEKDIPFKILLSHDPSHWDAQVCTDYKDIDLTLSGHTHGMQFGIDSKVFKWSPVQYMYSKWAGIYNEGKQYLYVNRGFGFLGYPGRLGVLPEITVIELV